MPDMLFWLMYSVSIDCHRLMRAGIVPERLVAPSAASVREVRLVSAEGRVPDT
jgi:hypothetical protein